jgi:hypothetical protein
VGWTGEGISAPAGAAIFAADANVAIPFKLRFGSDVLSFISTTMIFGTPSISRCRSRRWRRSLRRMN